MGCGVVVLPLDAKVIVVLVEEEVWRSLEMVDVFSALSVPEPELPTGDRMELLELLKEMRGRPGVVDNSVVGDVVVGDVVGSIVVGGIVVGDVFVDDVVGNNVMDNTVVVLVLVVLEVLIGGPIVPFKAEVIIRLVTVGFGSALSVVLRKLLVDELVTRLELDLLVVLVLSS